MTQPALCSSRASWSGAFSWILIPLHNSRNLEANLGDFQIFHIEVPMYVTPATLALKELLNFKGNGPRF